jgi:uncharacterized protein YkwD
VLAGALVAGAATALTGPATQSSADQAPISVDLTGERPAPSGSQGETTTSSTASSSPTSSTPTTTEAPPPPTTTVETTNEPPAEPPATTQPPPPADASAQDQVVSLTNAERQQAGCGPLSIDGNITAAAQAHASDMAARRYFEHTNLEGVTFDQRMRNAGYSQPGAENIARGATTAKVVVDMWMNSPGHRANILNCELRTIGVGLDRNGFYWVQDFGF